jgi:ornithine--oxo-acid transaminase
VGFDIRALIDERRGQAYALHEEHLNHQVPRVLHTIGFDREFVRAEGAYFWDQEGKRYLDFLAGFGVYGIGRNHPVVRKALHDVLDAELADMVQFDLPLLPGLVAEELLHRAPGMERVYFCNSGSEAVETALKFARRATGRRRIVFCDHAYHGLTAGALSVNGGKEFRKGFGPLFNDTAVPFGDLAALERELRRGDVAAYLIEPIQGKGVNIAPPGFLPAAKQLLEKHGALLICDEVQSGIGRTGKFFAYQHDDVVPDIVTVAKALSGGYVPIGATMAKGWIFEKVYSTLDRVFVHASTFMGNQLAMTAALATLSVLDDEQLIANAERRGDELLAGLRLIAEDHSIIADVRGRGLMIGIEFGPPKSLRLRASWNLLEAANKGLFCQLITVPLFKDHKILTQVSGHGSHTIKLLPPLTITEEDCNWIETAFDNVIAASHKVPGAIWSLGKTLVDNAVRKTA